MKLSRVLSQLLFVSLTSLTFVSYTVSHAAEVTTEEAAEEESVDEESADEGTDEAQDEEIAEEADALEEKDDFDSFDEESADSETAKEDEAETELEELDDDTDVVKEETPEDTEEDTAEAENALEEELDNNEEAIGEETPAESEPATQIGQNRGDSNDDPDLNLELRLHNIYMNFHNSKTPEEEWNTLVGQRRVESYQIQKGDNLWNISSTIFGDGNYWPKVWSLNSKIQNPHLITENNSIRFLFGTESEPPAFTVTENKSQTTLQIDSQSADPLAKIFNSADTETSLDIVPEIPAPLKETRPVLRKVPPSIPEWQDQAQYANYDELGIDYAKRKIIDIKDEIYLQGYIAETRPEFFGRVEEIEVGHKIASSYQYIYIAMKKGQGDIGETYLVIHNRGEVETTVPGLKARGYIIDIQGEVQLVEKVSSRDSDELDMYRALVLQIVNPVTTGSVLVKQEIEKIEITEKGPRSQVVAEIIGGVFIERRQIYGTESITFLNKGEKHGLAAGQILPIRAKMGLRNVGTRVESNIRPIGWLKILKTTPNLATAVIVKAWSDVITGDLTGSGDLVPSLGQLENDMDTDDGEDIDLKQELDDEDSSKPSDSDDFEGEDENTEG